MNRGLKILAIAMLVITVVGAGVVLYGVRALAPQVVQVGVTLTPAAQAQETFDGVIEEINEQRFGGRVFGDASSLDAQTSTFVTYTVRLRNSGFFPAEWFSLEVTPVSDETGGDVLQLANGGANVLTAGSTGDLAVTLLTTLQNPQQPRTIEITCYVFGQKTTVYAQAN